MRPSRGTYLVRLVTVLALAGAAPIAAGPHAMAAPDTGAHASVGVALGPRGPHCSACPD